MMQTSVDTAQFSIDSNAPSPVYSCPCIYLSYFSIFFSLNEHKLFPHISLLHTHLYSYLAERQTFLLLREEKLLDKAQGN